MLFFCKDITLLIMALSEGGGSACLASENDFEDTFLPTAQKPVLNQQMRGHKSLDLPKRDL